MDEKWVKPTVEEFCVNGECTAYSGVDAVRMVAEEAPATTAVPPMIAVDRPERSAARRESPSFGHGSRWRLPAVELCLPEL